MKNVVVLTDDEKGKSSFLQNLGMSIQPAYLCMKVTPTKVFNFQIFSVLTNDKKLFDYLIIRDGLIILIRNKLNEGIMDNIKTIIQRSPNKPILFLAQESTICKDLRPFCNVSHRKLFDIDPTLKQGSYNETEAKKWFNNILENKINSNYAVNNSNSQNISTKELAEQFEKCTLKLELWDHFGRLRIVYYSLMKYGWENTINPIGWLCNNWRRYKKSIGHEHLWNYTLTRFWANILLNLQKKYSYKTFRELYDNNPNIHNGSLYKEFYTNDILFSQYAKDNWVPPKLKTNLMDFGVV